MQLAMLSNDDLLSINGGGKGWDWYDVADMAEKVGGILIVGGAMTASPAAVVVGIVLVLGGEIGKSAIN